MNRENAKPFAHSKHYLYFWQKYSDQMNENVLALSLIHILFFPDADQQLQ